MASAEVILLDEINRIPLKSQSAFLEGLQDRTITVGKTTYELPAFSFAIATMNPVELGQGTFPAVGSGDRSVRDHGQHRLPAGERGREARRLRFQAHAPQPHHVEGAHHRAPRHHQRAGLSARAARQVHSATGRRHAAVQQGHRLARTARRRNWSNGASISAPRRARSSAGDVSRRSGRCWSAAAQKSFRKTSRISRPTSSAIASGSARTPPAMA